MGDRRKRSSEAGQSVERSGLNTQLKAEIAPASSSTHIIIIISINHKQHIIHINAH